ncbi:MAG: glycosyltransferase family 4 protein, partial [Pseudomonadota bacterium]
MISVLFVDSYPQAIAGQQETLTALLKACSGHGIAPTVAMPKDGVFAERLCEAGFPVEVLQQPHRIAAYGGAVYRYGLWGRLQMAVQVGRYVWRLRKWMQSRHFAAVYVNDMRGLLTFGLAARSLGVPVLIWDKLDKPHGLYDALQLPLASRNLMISQSVSTKYPAWQRRIWRGKIAVAHDGIDLSRFRPAERKAALGRLGIDPGPDTIVLGIIGTICERKGQDRLLAAFTAARSVLPDLVLLVIGSPEEETAEFADALRRNADKNVHWLGLRSDMPEVIPALDFLVSPSRHEGM